MSSTPVACVLVDSCVWCSRTLRDWIGILYVISEGEPFLVFWTEDIIAEVLHHLRKEHPQWSGGKIADVRDRLCKNFANGRVRDFVVDGYTGSDPHDAHVHGAAVACGADYLVTLNVKDFPGGDDLEYEVLTPDEFFMLVDDSQPELVRTAIREQVNYWLSRSRSAELPKHLRKAGCPNFAERVRQHQLTMQ